MLGEESVDEDLVLEERLEKIWLLRRVYWK